MIYTFRDVEFGEKQIMSVALRRVIGVGLSRSNYTCSVVGLTKTCRVGFVNYYAFFVITYLLKQYYGTDVFLKRMRENRLKEFLSFKSYKSIRFAAGLPIRGQHTHTNAQTAKQLRTRMRVV